LVPPPNTVPFENSAATLDGKLAEHYFDFSFYYPQSWQRDPTAGVPGARNFVKVERRQSPESPPQEDFAVGWYTSTGTFAGDSANFPQRVQEVSAALAKAYPEYRKVSEGPTKVNSMDAYEFRWQGLSKDESGDIKLWGRVVFLPTGKEGDTAGATIVMLSTSLAPELSSVEDIGEKGQAKVILDSFRFGKK
jgi:predicted RNA-binding protein with TRAM domain